TNESNIDQDDESDVLLESEKIKEIIAKLVDKSSYISETAQAVITYLQMINEPVVTEEILDDERIIAMVQDKENKLIRQEVEENDEDEIPDLSVIATKACNAMQTIIHYEEQENSESNLSLDELRF
ncbi:16028_t:CDS:1, partial [Racocetra persica]